MDKNEVSVKESIIAFAEFCKFQKGNCEGCACSHIRDKSICFIYFLKEVYKIDFFKELKI